MKNQIILFLVFTNVLLAQNSSTTKYSGYVIFEDGVLSEEYPTSTLITFNYKKEGDIKTISDGIEEDYDLYGKFGEDKIAIDKDGHEFRSCNYFSDLARKKVLIQIYKGDKKIRIIDGNDYLEYFVPDELNALKKGAIIAKFNEGETYPCEIQRTDFVNGSNKTKENSKGYIKFKANKIYFKNGDNDWLERVILSDGENAITGNYLYQTEYGNVEIDYINSILYFYEKDNTKCYIYRIVGIKK